MYCISWWHVFNAYLVWIAHLHCISWLHIVTAYLYGMYLYCISLLRILVAYLYCISLWRIPFAYRYCISLLHIGGSWGVFGAPWERLGSIFDRLVCFLMDLARIAKTIEKPIIFWRGSRFWGDYGVPKSKEINKKLLREVKRGYERIKMRLRAARGG